MTSSRITFRTPPSHEQQQSNSSSRATSLNPEMTSTTPGSSRTKKSRMSAPDVQKAKEKTRAKAGSIHCNSNTHSSNAARAVRVAGGSHGGLTPESHPKNLSEEIPPSVERMGGHQPLEPLQICSRTSGRFEQLLEKNSKLNNTSPLT